MSSNSKKGSLIIAGSGIASIRHITLETLSYIENADKVYYIVTDPATEAFIQEKSKGNFADLTIYYDKDKSRYESYVQMSEVMLHDVRAGIQVVGVFYGHPGVFVSPSHRAIAIALDEGFHAKMLPGISAEDYMFSDLGFDPAIPGCMTQEATSIVIHNKVLDPTIHNIIWQVGSVGVDTMVFDNGLFHLLVDHLEKYFGPNDKVIHYIGAVLPQSVTVKDEFTIAELREERIIKQITTVSTFYVPPREKAPVVQSLPEVLKSRFTTAIVSPIAYGEFERNAVSRIANHNIPVEHVELRASAAVRKFMIDLALKPDLQDRYKKDPVAVTNAIPELTAEERFALGLGKPGPVSVIMRATKSDLAAGNFPTSETIADSVGSDGLNAVTSLTVVVVTL
ncbi:uroporphyrin-iii c tetrapyrrole (corrin porphyrin) methyltransferase [Lentinula edodes]|uniref:Uroporphyrin-iii c tetrapyrrole (Corrin porphyrin) methyltransferase n=1 Tax=Lentinula edodes TaxID=5353 RepID=A0A1Q3EAH3_LENED|nr:uroporphyrin-iii c tetrapyrrole (corrin porphyrin) methyltransferase [Lentinula edodes]